MTLDEISYHLESLASCGDPIFEQAAQYIKNLVSQVQSGNMSKDEVAELLLDVQRQNSILEDASRLAFKETLNTVLNGLITLAQIA
jgi:hypothetical protein